MTHQINFPNHVWFSSYVRSSIQKNPPYSQVSILFFVSLINRMVARALSQLVYPFCTMSVVTGETRGLVPRHWRGLAVIEGLCLGHGGGKWPQGMLRLTKHVHFPSLDAAETLGH